MFVAPSAHNPFQTKFRDRRGFALVLVLAFVALLVGVCLAFFSNAALQSQISNSSAIQVKTSLFADGVANVIISDLKAEIVAGSNATTLADGSTKIYEPKTPRDMIPYQLPAWVGDPANNSAPLANLLKISGQTFHPGVAITDSGVETSTASTNGRAIQNNRWLKPLFLPSGTPLPVAPKWIDITRDGNTTASAIVGRYAFVIYNEGGLLDLNVAGYPGTAANWNAAMDPASKGALAYADLTQLGLSQANVDALVNWRNAASLATPGYKKYVEANRTGFLRTANTQLAGGANTDQMLVSRQQMISLLVDKLGWSKDTLPYFTSFSRDLNLPSLAPHHSSTETNPLPPLRSRSNGGNDQLDSTSNPATAYDKVNPKFLQIRATSNFPRNDRTRAVIGEPLVKQRFALSRLIWLTYQGPSEGKTGEDITDLTNPNGLGVSQAWLDQGTTENIQKYFGLEWEASNNCWRYNLHLNANGEIKTLAEIAAESPGRDPDFFEILKAAITAGALGKSGTSLASLTAPPSLGANSPFYLQYYRDSRLDYQVMQIGANMIDQSDVDGFPTHIRFGLDTAENIEFRGIENLPYLYRIRNAAYTTSTSSRGQFLFVQQPEVWNPHSYNPANLNRSLGNPRPTSFQLVAYPGRVNMDGTITSPSASGTPMAQFGSDAGGNWTVKAEWAGTRNSFSGQGLSFNLTPSLFREPTLLIAQGIPAGSNLSGFNNPLMGAGGVTIANGMTSNLKPSQTKYLGICLATLPLLDPTQTATACSAQLNWKQVTYQIKCNESAASSTMRAYDEKDFYPCQFTPRLGSVNKNAGDPNAGTYGNTAQSGNLQSYPEMGIISVGSLTVFVDPRTSRFGGIIHDVRGLYTASMRYPPYSPGGWLNSNDNTVFCNRPDTECGWGVSSYLTSDKGGDPIALYGFPTRTGWNLANNGSNPIPSVVFCPGFLSQNLRNASTSQYFDMNSAGQLNLAPTAPLYYSDSDGVVRRASGGYAINTTGLPMATAYASMPSPDSRPAILNRPFQSVGELGYVFSDTPWKNVDLSRPESGFSPLLDAFCINDSENVDGLVAGKVNLNTHQRPVLQAILTKAYRNAYATDSSGLQSVLANDAQTLAQKFLTRTTSSAPNKGPLRNLSDLIGRWVGSSTTTMNIDGSSASSYDGFAADLAVGTASQSMIPRYREAAIRALAANGTTRTWNLMVDLIAQSGRNTANGFLVEGEQRYWVHLAIDRFTGKVLDKQMEVVEE